MQISGSETKKIQAKKGDTRSRVAAAEVPQSSVAMNGAAPTSIPKAGVDDIVKKGTILLDVQKDILSRLGDVSRSMDGAKATVQQKKAEKMSQGLWSTSFMLSDMLALV
ncbi:hypothetical protein BSKO_02720 [Bryopsis sp. KO-2023]|nr:hypothetical protein BSKO_02720 [Bryopsis sp. KO-2023]